MRYENAVTLLASGRNGSKKIANNTYLYRIDADSIGVRLHATDVVIIHCDNTYTLNSGGWKTITTKDRINTYNPYRVSQKNFIWYVDGVEFFDGITVNKGKNKI